MTHVVKQIVRARTAAVVPPAIVQAASSLSFRCKGSGPPPEGCLYLASALNLLVTETLMTDPETGDQPNRTFIEPRFPAIELNFALMACDQCSECVESLQENCRCWQFE